MDYLYELKKELEITDHDVSYQNLCINYASRLLEKKLPVIFDKMHLSLLMGINYIKLNYYIANTEKFYKEVSIPKSRGGNRVITMPSFHLKELQRWLLDNVLYCYSIHGASYGFVPQRNIKDNAIIHINQNSVVNLDLKDFFPSIKFHDVFRLFLTSGYTKEISYTLSKLCTYKGILPQGAPTSPWIANILCSNLDKRIQNLVDSLGHNYSRYADDITISGDFEIKGLIPAVIKIIESEGFNINLQKIRIQQNIRFKEITGLIVGETVKVKRKYKKNLDRHIYYCEKKGVYSHLKFIKETEKSYFKEYLYGMANFIKMIEQVEGEKFLERLNKINWGRY